ncbi:sodium:solute symporter family protein [Pseudoxanthomonas winnipegensis]|uniref:sodium:solute symporter family protein n=1 Tax=Pseudoxanthomonas winnipegensis TaxID=2480810 RepID=UPI00197FE770|nr:sodium:solute symporter family protein [Pseudoxanthomonas winnipegensis]
MNLTLIAIVGGYMLALAAISFWARRYAKTAHSFTSGGNNFPAILIGFLLMSEFIGTTASVGTAQVAYKQGISSAWNLAALGVGFVLFAFLMARRFKDMQENTISGAMARTYGEPVRFATSVIMIFALQIVAISVYTSGGAVLAGLLKIDRTLAIVIVGVIGVLYVSLGGMRSVIYTNVLHAMVKYLGIAIALGYALSKVGGYEQLHARLPASMFSLTGVGWGQIGAWMVAGVGAVLATQYVVQAIATVPDGRRARAASFYSALLIVPFGIAAAIVGMCCVLLFPNINALQAFPTLVASMNDFMAGLVVAGLAGSLFGTISALSMGTATLIYKDFYARFFQRDKADEVSALRFVRIATIVVGLIPIPLAVASTEVLNVTFLAKSLRATLAVLLLIAFYAPRFGSPRGALASILLSLFVTIGWYLAGNPFGIDNAYVALAIPLVVMALSHPFRGKGRVAAGVKLEHGTR